MVMRIISISQGLCLPWTILWSLHFTGCQIHVQTEAHKAALSVSYEQMMMEIYKALVTVKWFNRLAEG